MPTARRTRDTAKPTAPPPVVPGLRARSRSGQPRRRAGLQFGAQWRACAPGELSEEQREAILADAALQTEPLPKH